MGTVLRGTGLLASLDLFPQKLGLVNSLMVVYKCYGIIGSETDNRVIQNLPQIILCTCFARLPKIIMQWHVKERCLENAKWLPITM